MTNPDSNYHHPDRARPWAFVLVALIALFVGYVLGLLGAQSPGGSRVGWPEPPANPRSLNP